MAKCDFLRTNWIILPKAPLMLFNKANFYVSIKGQLISEQICGVLNYPKYYLTFINAMIFKNLKSNIIFNRN